MQVQSHLIGAGKMLSVVLSLTVLFVYNNLDLSNLVWKGKSITKELEVDLEEDTYYWVVKPYDEAGNSGSESAVFKFQVND